jgi:hypothetical protein
MSRSVKLISFGTAIVLSALAGSALADPTPAVPALTASSRAAVVDLDFIINGQKTDPAAELLVSGSAPPTYNKKVERSTYAKTTKILGGLGSRLITNS